MLKILDARRIEDGGAEPRCANVVEPVISRINGKTIALIAFTDNQPEWGATRKLLGIAYVAIGPSDDRLDRLFETIMERQNGAITIVSAHWGVKGIPTAKGTNCFCA